MPKGVYERTEEHKKKLSKSAKKRYQDKTKHPMYGVHRYGKEAPNYGRKHTEEAKKRMSKSHKGMKKPWASKRGKLLIGIKNPFYGKKHSTEYKRKMSLARRGGNNYNWRGGITSLYVAIRNLSKYKQWRSDVFRRDNWTCQTCNKRGGEIKLQSHHIKSCAKIIRENKIKNIEEARLCPELWDINNGVTLCVECHRLTDNFGGIH